MAIIVHSKLHEKSSRVGPHIPLGELRILSRLPSCVRIYKRGEVGEGSISGPTMAL